MTSALRCAQSEFKLERRPALIPAPTLPDYYLSPPVSFARGAHVRRRRMGGDAVLCDGLAHCTVRRDPC